MRHTVKLKSNLQTSCRNQERTKNSPLEEIISVSYSPFRLGFLRTQLFRLK